jgi:hypothetical protein
MLGPCKSASLRLGYFAYQLDEIRTEAVMGHDNQRPCASVTEQVYYASKPQFACSWLTVDEQWKIGGSGTLSLSQEVAHYETVADYMAGTIHETL